MRIGKIFGIDIFVNVSWLFVFALVAWSLASNVSPLHLDALTPTARAVLAVVTAFFFFVSVLLHELAHSLLARMRGIPVNGITLFIFGGVSRVEKDAAGAPTEAWISLIGPLMSLGLFLLFAQIAHFLAGGKTPTVPVRELRMAWAVSFGYLSYANLMLALFNMLPAYPLDGGRILHALLWRMTNNSRRATMITGVFSRIIAGCIICYGIAATLSNDLSGGPWLTFIGVFLFQAGEAEQVAARIGDALRGHEARELAKPAAVQIAADSTASAALYALLTAHVNAAPVFIGERFIGIVTLQDLVRVSEPDQTYVTAAMTQRSGLPSIHADADAGEVTRQIARSATTMLPVLDDSGEVVGFLTRENVLEWIATRSKNKSSTLP